MPDKPLPLDVLERLRRDFGDRVDAMAAILLSFRQSDGGYYLNDRLVRCIVHAARGDEQRAQELLQLAREDSRDLIVAGEYDDAMRQVRDLRASFLIDSPEKFWAGELFCMMNSRGYRPIALQTHLARPAAFNYGANYCEGRATFIGPKGEIVVEKKDRQWMIHGDQSRLEIHELNRPFTDERTFLDALSGYLLSKV
jgi:hypothetical protein